MQDLIKRIGRFVENHVEKIVLVIVGLVCVVLFFKWVIFSPAVVTVDGKKLSAGRVDKEIFAKAQELERSINSGGEGQKAPGVQVRAHQPDRCEQSGRRRALRQTAAAGVHGPVPLAPGLHHQRRRRSCPPDAPWPAAFAGSSCLRGLERSRTWPPSTCERPPGSPWRS